MAYVCFYLRYSDCIGVCENLDCVAGVVKDRGMVKYIVCLCRGVIDVVFSV